MVPAPGLAIPPSPRPGGAEPDAIVTWGFALSGRAGGDSAFEAGGFARILRRIGISLTIPEQRVLTGLGRRDDENFRRNAASVTPIKISRFALSLLGPANETKIIAFSYRS